ncbi:SigE family RNA polymerase sigma factor [Spirillospora sp. CA-294931]|uniref:SigE family RNA polymerase sigma factor n=1 Tax=Spirillospora sp. CA-294931 TaxID=3240042 RepID=UPI003D8A7565
MADREAYAAFVGARSDRLLRTAYLLTRDRGLAEDLLQEAMAKAWFAWRRLGDEPEPYVRKIMVTTFVSWRRRRWRGETPTGDLPDTETARDATSAADERDVLWRALGRLPARQRAVIVLRYYEDLSEAQTADLLGCSVGTVKSQASRALAKLRVDDSLLSADMSGGNER